MTTSSLTSLVNNRGYWLLFISLLVLTVFGADLAERGTSSTPDFMQSPEPQSAPLEVDDLLLAATAEFREPDPLVPAPIGPFRLEVGPEDHVFVIDEGLAERIVEYAPNGEFLGKLGGEDQPGVSSVSDLSATRDHLRIADLLANSIHVIDRAYGTWQTIEVADASTYRVETMSSISSELLLMQIAEPKLFAVVTQEGEVVRLFGSLLKEQEYHSLLLDGYIAKAGASVIYTGRHLGLLASFSERGQLEYIVESIEPPAMPYITERDGIRRVKSPRLFAAKAIAISPVSELVLVLSDRASGLAVRSFLDMYDLRTGEYCRSLGLPAVHLWNSVTLSSSAVYASYRNGVVRWNGTLDCDHRQTKLNHHGSHLFAVHPTTQ